MPSTFSRRSLWGDNPLRFFYFDPITFHVSTFVQFNSSCDFIDVRSNFSLPVALVICLYNSFCTTAHAVMIFYVVCTMAHTCVKLLSRLRDDELDHMNAGLQHGAEQVGSYTATHRQVQEGTHSCMCTPWK